MFTTKPYTPEIYLIDKNGVRIKSWNTLLRCAIELPLFFKCKNLYYTFFENIGNGNRNTPSVSMYIYKEEEKYFPYLLQDSEGNDITFRSLYNALNATKKAWTGADSMPGSKRRGRHRDYLRYPKTLTLLKMAGSTIEEEGEPEFRASRTKNYIRTAWDDKARTMQRSWKEHRKTQWK